MAKAKSTQEISDMYLGAYLLAKDGKITSVRKEGSIVYFTIEGEDLQERIMEYLNGKADTNVRKYLDCLKTIRTTIYDIRMEQK